MIKTILRLRRDNAYNYDKIKDTFIPANGEICLVDTPKDGLRVICGDGIKTFGELEFMDNVIIHGYYSNNKFYKDKDLKEETITSITKLYFDIITAKFYYFYNDEFNLIGGSESFAKANETTEGIMKLYSTLGDNEDGTITQKLITKELSEKVEIALNIDEETIIFSNDLF